MVETTASEKDGGMKAQGRRKHEKGKKEEEKEEKGRQSKEVQEEQRI